MDQNGEAAIASGQVAAASSNLEVLQAARNRTEQLLACLEVDPATYKLGNTQV